MSFSNTITKYTLYYFGKRPTRGSSPTAQIILHNARNKYIGNVEFYKDSQALPNNASIETTNPKQAFVRMHERRLDTIINMLQNEKPCSVHYYNPTTAYLFTGREPIGEEES